MKLFENLNDNIVSCLTLRYNETHYEQIGVFWDMFEPVEMRSKG